MSVRTIFRCFVLFVLLGVALWANAAPLWAADALPATPPATPPVVDSTLPTDTQENAAAPDGEGETPPDTTPRFGFALKPTYMVMVHSSADDLIHGAGLNFQFDYYAIPHWLDVSFDFSVLVSSWLVLDIPIAVTVTAHLMDSNRFWPYIGLGAKAMFTRVLIIENLYGGVVLAGVKWLLFTNSGLLAEFRFSPLYMKNNDGSASFQKTYEISLGYVWRF